MASSKTPWMGAGGKPISAAASSKSCLLLLGEVRLGRHRHLGRDLCGDLGVVAASEPGVARAIPPVLHGEDAVLEPLDRLGAHEREVADGVDDPGDPAGHALVLRVHLDERGAFARLERVERDRERARLRRRTRDPFFGRERERGVGLDQLVSRHAEAVAPARLLPVRDRVLRALDGGPVLREGRGLAAHVEHRDGLDALRRARREDHVIARALQLLLGGAAAPREVGHVGHVEHGARGTEADRCADDVGGPLALAREEDGGRLAPGDAVVEPHDRARVDTPAGPRHHGGERGLARALGGAVARRVHAERREQAGAERGQIGLSRAEPAREPGAPARPDDAALGLRAFRIGLFGGRSGRSERGHAADG
jgi:hypothetical protein